ncbi:MAG TPA: hypothetical protein VEQ60_30030 [Longimicrobium sp.]|nr:hypothetical protein [Longimicrobium sp.]
MSDTMTQDQATGAPGTLDLQIGIVAPADAPRPDLNGLRIKAIGEHQPVYLILEGTRRLIPNLSTYDNLFIDRNGIYTAIDLHLIPEGAPVSNGAVLAFAEPRPAEEAGGPVVLVTNEMQWFVGTMAKRYHLDLKKARSVPGVIMASVASGPSLK